MCSSHGFLLFCLFVTLFQPHFRFATSKPSGLSIRAFVDDSPGSPLYRVENLTRSERIEKLIKITDARAKYLNLVSNPNASVVVPDNIPMPIFREGLFYVVQFALGSQGHIVKLLLDTGSGLTWTQCLPCIQCFPQHLPIFNPGASHTYARLPCDHPLCQGQDSSFTCENGECRYISRYAGGHYTKGVGSMETVHFFSGTHIESSDDFVFGCSDYTSSDFVYKDTDISGIFGIDLSRVSLMQQLGTRIHSRFSYCLAPFAEAIPRPLILRFGEDIPKQQVQSTLFVTSIYNKYYNLELLDISVGGYRIGFGPHTFRERGPGQGGCIIDSGSLFTQIDGATIGVNAFEEVARVFEAYYGARGLTRVTSVPGFELCFNRQDTYSDFASVTFHFNGADYKVDGQYMHLMPAVPETFCVAILRGGFASILGAWSQQNKRIIYDGMFDELQFADEDCIKDIS